jgi:DNA-binding HxlR family transcriptional regulator
MTENRNAPNEELCVPTAKLPKALMLLQEKWVLFIINGLLGGALGFNELSRRASGVNTTTLSLRMDLLEREGIVRKTVFSTIPPRTSYELTPKGHALRPVIDAIAAWAEAQLTDTTSSEPPGIPNLSTEPAKLKTD